MCMDVYNNYVHMHKLYMVTIRMMRKFMPTTFISKARRKMFTWKHFFGVDINNVHWTADFFNGGHIKSVFQALSSQW